MENKPELWVLRSIGNVYEAAHGSKLDDDVFLKIKPELVNLSGYFKVSETQAFFLAVVFTMNYKGDTVDIKDMVAFFDCNPVKLLAFIKDIETLYSKSLFLKIKSEHRLELAFSNDQFVVNKLVSDAIINNLPLPALEKKKPDTLYSLLEELYKLGKQRSDGLCSTNYLMLATDNLLNSCATIPIIDKISKLDLKIDEKYLLLYVIWKTINGNESTDMAKALGGIYEDAFDRFIWMQKIISGESELIKQKLCELETYTFFDNTDIKLGPVTIEMLNKEGISIYMQEKKPNNLMLPEQIKHKELFYNDEEKNQQEILKQIFDEKYFKSIQTRLSEKGLPKGITVLLYGPPGTGKTESVYQLARQTQRGIVWADISQSKSMWFGESEKIIKRIFNEYNAYAKKCEIIPILLFNEADAIISKRKDAASSNVAQVENTMQNIILEELEKFEGLFIATTNMVENFDPAFERRFLIKIELKMPDTSVMQKIWKAKLPFLSGSECEMLSERFDFTGAQIDNIFRKIEMQEIITSQLPDFNTIEAFCQEEKYTKHPHTKIGFTL